MFDVEAAPTTDLRFEFSIDVYQIPQRVPREVLIETSRGERIDRWSLSAPEMERSIVVPPSAWTGSRICLRFHFDEAASPGELGLSEDRRALSIKLRRLCIGESSSRSTTPGL
jgi:hypothetical protein